MTSLSILLAHEYEVYDLSTLVLVNCKTKIVTRRIPSQPTVCLPFDKAIIGSQRGLKAICTTDFRIMEYCSFAEERGVDVTGL